MTAHATAERPAISDPMSDKPVVPYEKLEEVFEDIRSHVLYDHELYGCLNCGICTATCPSAHYYDYSPREIVQLLWTENLEGIYDAMQEKIWACAQCYTCAARCPFHNSPGGLVMIMREVAIKHGMQSAKDVLRPFSRVLLKVISTGNQLAPNMITPATPSPTGVRTSPRWTRRSIFCARPSPCRPCTPWTRPGK